MPDMIGANVDPFATIDLCARHGIAGIDLRLDRFDTLFEGRAAVARFTMLLAEKQLRPGYVSILPGKVNVDQPEWDRGIARLPKHARLTRDLGYTRCAAVVLCGHDSLDFKQQWDLHVSRIRQAMDVLNEYGIRLALEYVAPLTRRAAFKHPFIHTLRELLELFKAIDRPGVGVLLDCFHWYCARETVADITALTSEQVVVVHVNDAIPNRPIDEQTVAERLLPGESGVIDLAGFFAALDQIRYDGPVTCEPTHPMWASIDPEVAVQRTAESLRRFIPAGTMRHS
jgi:sugar phosphate isomerase/epimerase